MNKKDIFIGFVIGILVALLGSILFIKIFTDFEISTGIQTIKQYGYLGKVIALGTTLDLIAFTIFLKTNKEFMAGGVIFAVIAMAISTLFI